MNNYKYLTEMEKFEIININDGDRYNLLGNNDIIVDEEGNLKCIAMLKNKGGLFGRAEVGREIPWEAVRKIGSKTVIIDIGEELLK